MQTWRDAISTWLDGEWFCLVKAWCELSEVDPDAIGSGAPLLILLYGARLHCSYFPIHKVSSTSIPLQPAALRNTAPYSTPTGIQAPNTPLARRHPERAARDTANRGLSKSTRIMILLAIDTAFFFLELIVGYSVHSLALVADSFHMVRRDTVGMSQTNTNVSSAERCDITPRRTVGGQGRKPADKLQTIHIWLAARGDTGRSRQRCLPGGPVSLHLPRSHPAIR
jgi:hypothetical protein